MSIFDTLFGVSDARVNAPRIDSAAGTRAIRQASRNMGSQLGAQQYGMAASARGASGPLALREAQRRSAMGQQQIGAQTVAQQAQLEQNTAAQNAQMELAAQQANANIEVQNDQAFSRGLGGLISTGATAAMMMSDARAKENVTPLYSDFVAKEPPGRFGAVDYQIPDFGPRPVGVDVAVPREAPVSPLRPAPVRIAPADMPYRGPVPTRRPDAESRAAFGLDRVQRPTNTLEQGAIERRVVEDIQRPELRSGPARYRPQMMRPGVQPEELSNPAIARHLADRREKAELDAELARLPREEATNRKRDKMIDAFQAFGGGLVSDKRAKEKAFADGARAAMMRSPMTPGYGPPLVPPPMAPRYGSPRPMVSDFAAKEMTADESRAALAPVQPVRYQYKPEHAERMALEQGSTPEERSMVYADKRAPRDGIIAQDLLKSKAFRPAVMNSPAGLAVERDRAISTTMAAAAGQAKVNEEQDDEISDLKRLVSRYLRREVAA